MAQAVKFRGRFGTAVAKGPSLPVSAGLIWWSFMLHSTTGGAEVGSVCVFACACVGKKDVAGLNISLILLFLFSSRLHPPPPSLVISYVISCSLALPGTVASLADAICGEIADFSVSDSRVSTNSNRHFDAFPVY